MRYAVELLLRWFLYRTVILDVYAKLTGYLHCAVTDILVLMLLLSLILIVNLETCVLPDKKFRTLKWAETKYTEVFQLLSDDS